MKKPSSQTAESATVHARAMTHTKEDKAPRNMVGSSPFDCLFMGQGAGHQDAVHASTLQTFNSRRARPVTTKIVSKAAFLRLCVAWLLLGMAEALAFQGLWNSSRRTSQLSSCSRRGWMIDIGRIALPSLTFVDLAFAEDGQASTSTEMKKFVDPLFVLDVPKDFFTIRRTRKGDLPDASTGKGRRGSSIFTAGNMAKAEVIAVELYPLQVLLAENGIEATGDLTTFPSLGDPRVIANLIVAHREQEIQNQGTRSLEEVSVSPDGKDLSFRLRTEIEVQKPELLLEEYGLSQLFRITVAKATLNSSDGNLMAIFASALEQDFNNGNDGKALEESVKSFIAFDQSSKNPM